MTRLDGSGWFHEEKAESPQPLEPEPPVRQPRRLPSDPEVIERLRGWAEEFDGLDAERYAAVDFIEWLELEHKPRIDPARSSNGASRGLDSYPVWTDAVAL